MKHDQKCPGFVHLPDGSHVRGDTIFAVVPGSRESLYPGSPKIDPWRVLVRYSPCRARVAIEYESLSNAFVQIIPCNSMADRDEMIADIMRAIKVETTAVKGIDRGEEK